MKDPEAKLAGFVAQTPWMERDSSGFWRDKESALSLCVRPMRNVFGIPAQATRVRLQAYRRSRAETQAIRFSVERPGDLDYGVSDGPNGTLHERAKEWALKHLLGGKFPARCRTFHVRCIVEYE